MQTWNTHQHLFLFSHPFLASTLLLSFLSLNASPFFSLNSLFLSTLSLFLLVEDFRQIVITRQIYVYLYTHTEWQPTRVEMRGPWGAVIGRYPSSDGSAQMGGIIRHNRKCRDVAFLVIFIAFWIAMIVNSSFGFNQGNPLRSVFFCSKPIPTSSGYLLILVFSIYFMIFFYHVIHCLLNDVSCLAFKCVWDLF